MFSVINKSKDIYFNLALEEYLLRSHTEDFFIIWQSDTAIVAGKHQNIMAEVNHEFVRKHNIPLARRISGGGTVFHGPGNLNFTFIQNGKKGKLVDFNHYVKPIISFLKIYGIDAAIGTKHELLVSGKKISGNAEHVYKNRVLHHGTLLYSANLKWLNESIRLSEGKYIDKAVQSHRSEVCNISDCTNLTLTVDEFSTGLYEYLLQALPGSIQYEPTAADLQEVMELAKNKYASPEWIYGYSPPFERIGSFSFNSSPVRIDVKVEKGIITKARFTPENNIDSLHELTLYLNGIEFRYEPFQLALAKLKVSDDVKREILRAVFQ